MNGFSEKRSAADISVFYGGHFAQSVGFEGYFVTLMDLQALRVLTNNLQPLCAFTIRQEWI
jgi:hypothetical protein